jgi:hypothetical protein
MPQTSLLLRVAIAALALAFAGCGSVRNVAGTMTTRDRILFIYQDDYRDPPSGVVDCKRAPDGALSDCRRKPIVYSD